MTAAEQSCTRRSIEAVVPQYTYWRVDDAGKMLDLQGEDDLNRSDVVGYYCWNCHCHFLYDEERDDPWQAALDHLPKPETPEPAAMSCCLPSMPRRAVRSDTA